MIPKNLEDPTTLYHHHTMLTYLPCVILRITLGLAIFFGYLSENVQIIIASVVILIFSLKLHLKTWKNYIRTILIYFIVLVLNLNSKLNFFNLETSKKNLICGVLIIMDALLGQQSRFTANLLA